MMSLSALLLVAMKIDITPDFLVIDSQPWGVSLGVAAALLTVIGAGLGLLTAGAAIAGILFLFVGAPLLGLFLIALARRNQLVLDRRQRLALHRRRTIFGYAERTMPLDRLERAVVQTRADNAGTTYRLGYVLSPGPEGGPWLFTWAFSSDPRVPSAARAMNAWLRHAPQRRAG